MSDVALMDAPVEFAEDYRSMTLLNEMGDVEVTWDADHGDAVPLRAPTADIQGDAALVVQEGLDALDEILNQMPPPRDMDHARLIEQALEQVLEADTEWVDPIGY